MEISIAGNYNEQVDILRCTFQERFIKLREIVKVYLKKANKLVWKCDTIINNGMYGPFTSNICLLLLYAGI